MKFFERNARGRKVAELPNGNVSSQDTARPAFSKTAHFRLLKPGLDFFVTDNSKKEKKETDEKNEVAPFQKIRHEPFSNVMISPRSSAWILSPS